MKTPVFEGSCTALITPFTENGIDFTALRSQTQRQILGGTAAVVIAGTTGEHSTLSRAEFERLTEFVIRTVAGQMKTIVCVGGNDTAECLSKAKFAESAGADATLLTAPYYNKTSPCGLISHFSRVAEGRPFRSFSTMCRVAPGSGFPRRSTVPLPGIRTSTA